MPRPPSLEMPRPPSLDSQLRTVSSDLDAKEFVTLDVLEKVITKPNVASELGRTNSLLARTLSNIARSDVSSRITAQARKIFAILVLLDRTAAIQGLLDEGLTDEHLPLSRSPDHEALVSWDGVEFPFTGWKPASVNLFVKQQWPFLAPILDTTGQLINVNQESPLPFTKTDIIGSGAAGVVY
ncbi:Protein kinase domain-containing protein [Fusarium sp. LHS14.1]|nr:Protein kinase domain-containing protein [Fusarium sp. LHS14.1]